MRHWSHFSFPFVAQEIRKVGRVTAFIWAPILELPPPSCWWSALEVKLWDAGEEAGLGVGARDLRLPDLRASVCNQQGNITVLWLAALRLPFSGLPLYSCQSLGTLQKQLIVSGMEPSSLVRGLVFLLDADAVLALRTVRNLCEVRKGRARIEHPCSLLCLCALFPVALRLQPHLRCGS